MAHTKAKGSTKLGRESESKRLGVKVNHAQGVKAGEVIIRQRGTKYYAGVNVRRGGDDTLYAVKNGTVRFATRQRVHFDGSKFRVKSVSVETAELPHIASPTHPVAVAKKKTISKTKTKKAPK